MHPDDSGRAPRPVSWAHRALGAGGRALETAGHALSSAEQRGSSHLGTAHLGSEALVAYVDGELGMGAHQRAAAHLAVCTECAADVQAQLQARSAVRAAGAPCTPAGLLGVLRQIPEVQPPAGPLGPTARGAVVQDTDGAWVSVLRPERFGGAAAEQPTGGPPRAPRRRGFPLVVLTVSALAVGVLVAAPSPPGAPAAGSGVAPVHTARLPGPMRPTAPTVVVVGVPATPQTATSPAAGQAGRAGARALV